MSAHFRHGQFRPRVRPAARRHQRLFGFDFGALWVRSRRLRITIERSADTQTHEIHKSVKLELVGNDRPGIVRDVTRR